MTSSKVMTAREAVSRFIQDGQTVTVGGFWHAISYALTHEIIRQGKKHLTICAAGFNEQADQMIGAGCVDRVVTSYLWLEVFGPTYAFRRAVEKGIPHKIEIEDYSNFSMTMRFMAGALGIPYIPLNSLKGSDMMNFASWMGGNKVKLVEDPFGSGVQHALVPALRPDVGYLHAQRADEEGNVQLWGTLGDSPWSVRACRKIIVSVEEIVSREDIGKDPNRTVIPAYKVAAVVKEPYGAHPKGTQGYYREDREFLFDYVRRTKTEEGWREFMNEWVYGVKDRTAYIEKFIATYGYQKHLDLKAESMQSGSVNYGY
jgi:glutaconate CoA-transferase subunit A